jgi:hypothetical protein
MMMMMVCMYFLNELECAGAAGHDEPRAQEDDLAGPPARVRARGARRARPRARARRARAPRRARAVAHQATEARTS